ncbi:glutamate ABC transporter substrate-binding protein [Streptomyces albireticuli]|uniref:ABC transporter substrate-binding protein n=1 Tax=Streptomyces albireticuli TaxID=1940 RepID=A0A2A2DFJ5_9ACTN|nr:glutamate ABC transporter substrate-binding protein [Streptomyces albireticuli]MCD9145601.1 glutamate ABC transporter substrate-binding protein [Streptomyces albireticuli]MCD9165109.1 glutamate ABC transporter substrate-binding protein [Streptomyces albireticuli]MCD9195638.1 glutamate ABC transporter substrate-binding protein [Streptomyces albireticuli]PAU50246.1 ABC transporter substrate-binding protein [Streptomyces albireticuli]
MKLRKTAAAAAVVLALTATATACGKSGSPDDKSDKAGDNKSAPPTPTYKVNTAADVKDSPVFEKIKGKTITIGTKADQPGLGYENPGTKKRTGFDVEIARMIAADLGFDEAHIKWQTIPSEARETQIASGGVDLYVGTYTINDERKKQVGFGGPYYIAGQDLLVKADSDIKGPDDLKGKKVCSASGSTPLKRIKEPKYGVAEAKAQQTYQLCVQEVVNGTADALTTDDSILKGYAAQNKGALKVVGNPFSKEPYGVGLKKEDKALRNAVNDALEAHMKNGDWKKAYDATLGLSGVAASNPPAVDRY